ncbi:hypothetical protein [Scytonema sp. PCC 10023]|uniref:hypothetical protein n=1 Tax=Scytonema sp. PCC 10023 TaxID=1680591 RepID=UPI0039C5D2C3
MEGIEVRHIRSKKLMWRQTLDPTTRKTIYQGEPLQPGEDYFWRETLPPEQLPSQVPFRIMESEKRDRITGELNKLENREKEASGTSAEKIILARVEYFANQGLWSDALREIYSVLDSVPNPSVEFKQGINQIQNNEFCSFKAGQQKLGFVFWK